MCKSYECPTANNMAAEVSQMHCLVRSLVIPLLEEWVEVKVGGEAGIVWKKECNTKGSRSEMPCACRARVYFRNGNGCFRAILSLH